MRITQKDCQLIEVARKVAEENCDIYADLSMHVGCALLAKSGKFYKGINIKTSHSVCAEQVALGQAFACGEREFETIVAVKMDKEGKTMVVSPCGLCRYIFDKFGLKINVIVQDIATNTTIKVPASKLLPYPYKTEERVKKTKE